METVIFIVNALLGAGIVQGLFLAILLYSRKSGPKRANRILALLMVAFSLNIAHPLLIPELVALDMRIGGSWAEAFQFLFAPMIFFYIREITGRQTGFRLKNLLHFIPFLLSSALIIVSSVVGGRGIVQFMQSVDSLVFDVIFWGCVILQLSIYIILSIVEMSRFRHSLEEEFSSIWRKKLDWMHLFIFIFSGITVLYFVLLLLRVHGHLPSYFLKIETLALSAVVFGIGYRGLSQSRGFFAISDPDENATVRGTEGDGKILKTDPDTDLPQNKTVKYEKSGLTNEDLEMMGIKLMEYLTTKKPYLEPEISLSDLASQMGLSRNQLSLVINERFKMTFYNLINSYRLEAAKRILRDPARENDKILTVAIDAGFNSKAVFNKFFKRMTGITPREYREMT